jgi:SAM-dependent methyltransferase
MTFTGERFVPELRGQIAYEHFHRYAVACELARDRDVLDIASGEGFGSSLLALVARSVTGVDIDEASIRHAAARYPAMNLAFRPGSATAIPIADASVDLVVSFETLEHLGEHREMMAEFVRVLRANGRLVISSPNKRVYSDARGYTNEYHVRELYFDEFRDLLQEFFPQIRSFGHRIFGASAIHPLTVAADHTPWLGPAARKTAGIVALPDAEYFIAVCGRSADDDLPDVSSVYLDVGDDLLDDVRSGGLAASHHAFTEAAGAELAERQSEESSAARERLQEHVAKAESERDEACARIAQLEERLGRTAVVVQETSAKLLEARGESERFRASCRQLEENVAQLLGSLGQSSLIVRSLSEAQGRATEIIAALELGSVPAGLAVRQLRLERMLLADALGLREQRVAALEAAFHEPTAEKVRTTTATGGRVRAMLARLRGGKFWKLRSAMRRLLDRAADGDHRVNGAIERSADVARRVNGAIERSADAARRVNGAVEESFSRS